jgi:hypothetical protein
LPKDAEAAKKLWQWRLNDRPPPNSVDDKAPNGDEMMREMSELKDSLYKEVRKAYKKTALTAAKDAELTFGRCKQIPKEKADLVQAICELKDPDDKAINTVYSVFYKPFPASWLAGVIDKWFLDRGLELMPEPAPKPGEKAKKTFVNARGGFGALAKSSHGNARRTYTETAFKKNGWKLGTTGPKMEKEGTPKKKGEPGEKAILYKKNSIYEPLDLPLAGGNKVWLIKKVQC